MRMGVLAVEITFLIHDHNRLTVLRTDYSSLLMMPPTLFPRIHRHAVMYETEVSRHAVIVIQSPNYQKTMITKDECVSYITAPKPQIWIFFTEDQV